MYRYSLQPISQARGCTSPSRSHRGQRPHRLHLDANCHTGYLGLMSMQLSLDQCPQPPGAEVHVRSSSGQGIEAGVVL